METRITSAGGGKSSVSDSRTGKRQSTPRGGSRRSTAVPKLLKRKREGLSFVSDVYLGRRFQSIDWFDVPDESCRDGWRTGQLVAAEFMVAMQAPAGERYFNAVGVITAAARALRCEAPIGKSGAAHGFLNGLVAMIGAASKYVDHRKYFSEAIALNDQSASRWKARAAQEKSDFVARMRAAKALKKAKAVQQ